MNNKGMITTAREVAETLERSARNYPDAQYPSNERFTNCAAKLREAADRLEKVLKQGPPVHDITDFYVEVDD